MGELVHFSKGTGYSKADLKEFGIPLILYGRLYTKYQTVITEVDTFADAKPVSVYSQGGEVIVPASGETAEDISIASVVEKSGVLLGGDLNIITPPDGIDSAFLAISISNGKPHDDMAKMAQGKSVVHLHNADLEKINLLYPDHTEQIKISGYFKQLDNLITLHQRMCVFLGSTLQIRMEYPLAFAWEQRKLGEAGTTFTGLSGKTKDDFGHGLAKFVTYMNVFSNPVSSPTLVESVEIDDSQSKVLAGDVLFTTSSETPEEVGMSSVWLENADDTYLNSFCFGYRPTEKFDKYYLAYMLRSDAIRKKIIFLAQGISRYNISKNKVMEIEIPIPKLEEQQRIGLYFRTLDDLITLHQRKPKYKIWRYYRC